MFVPLTEKERQSFFQQNSGSYIPGYTGHCPTLRFQYGTSYGTKTKEILQDLRDKNVIKTVQRTPYRHNDAFAKEILQPIVRNKGQMRDPIFDTRYRSPKYIIGYTGFIPTLNFRYGKSYGRAADDSMYEFDTNQRRISQAKDEMDRLRAKSAPKMTSIRNKDDVKYILKQYEGKNRFKDREISPDFPPIAGYTGHIPKVKGNEASLSQRYNTVVKRSLTLLREEREKRNEYKNSQDKIQHIIKKVEGRYK